MARKHLLDGLIKTDTELPAGNPAPPAATPAAAPLRRGLGPLGAVSRSFENLQALTIKDLEPALIDESAIVDRLSINDESVEELAAQIRENGQQVPILVRPGRQAGRYEIVYGRRRLRACTLLGRKVRAEIKALTDEEQVVAQGQENSSRKDLTFIERALFAGNLEAAGHSRDIIMRALSVDKTGLSKLITSAVKIPRDIIGAIGPAPKTGRDRWGKLYVLLQEEGREAIARDVISSPSFVSLDSDARFQAVCAALTPAPEPTIVRHCVAPNGETIAEVRGARRSLSLSLDQSVPESFADFIVDQLPELYAAFQRRADT